MNFYNYHPFSSRKRDFHARPRKAPIRLFGSQFRNGCCHHQPLVEYLVLSDHVAGHRKNDWLRPTQFYSVK